MSHTTLQQTGNSFSYGYPFSTSSRERFHINSKPTAVAADPCISFQAMCSHSALVEKHTGKNREVTSLGRNKLRPVSNKSQKLSQERACTVWNHILQCKLQKHKEFLVTRTLAMQVERILGKTLECLSAYTSGGCNSSLCVFPLYIWLH